MLFGYTGQVGKLYNRAHVGGLLEEEEGSEGKGEGDRRGFWDQTGKRERQKDTGGACFFL